MPPRTRSARSTAAFDANDPAARAAFFRDLSGTIDHVMSHWRRPALHAPPLEMDVDEASRAIAVFSRKASMVGRRRATTGGRGSKGLGSTALPRDGEPGSWVGASQIFMSLQRVETEAVVTTARRLIEATDLPIVLYGQPDDEFTKFHPSGLPLDAFDHLRDLTVTPQYLT